LGVIRVRQTVKSRVVYFEKTQFVTNRNKYLKNYHGRNSLTNEQHGTMG